MNLDRIVIIILSAVIVFIYVYFQYIQVNNALRLYQIVQFSDEYSEVQRSFHNDFKEQFTEEDYLILKEAISNGPAKAISNHIVFEYRDGTKVRIEIAPGTMSYKIVDIEIENN